VADGTVLPSPGDFVEDDGKPTAEAVG
jgi:hypothetical protein